MKNIKRYVGMMMALVTVMTFRTPNVNVFAAEWVLQTATKLEEAEERFEFCLGDYNGDGILDLYAIKKSSTGSRTTELHVLDGKSNFQKFLLQTATKLEEAGERFEFCLGDYNGDGILDLYAIKKSSTGSRTTELHVLDGKSNFQEFLLQTATKLEEAGERFEFCLGDYNRNGTLELYAIKKSSTGSRTTEVHTLTVDGSQVIKENSNEFDPIWPCTNTYTVTALYKYSKGDAHRCRFRYGIDIGAPYGEQVVAVEDGKVICSEYSTTSGFGNWIMIEHSNGKVSLYAHLSSRKVSVGDAVSKGQVIGAVGNTSAKYSIGAHLHFELGNSNTSGAAGDSYQEYYKTKYADKIILTQAAQKYNQP